MAVSAPTVTISEIEATAVISEVEASTVVTEVGTSVVATEIDASAVMTEVEATIAITEVEATAAISEIEATAVITEVEASAVITEVDASVTISETQNFSDDSVIINGTFDSDLTGWVNAGGAAPTFEWVASGGGFTGTLHGIFTASNHEFSNSVTLLNEGLHFISADVNVVSSNHPDLGIRLELGVFGALNSTNGLGLQTLSGFVSVNQLSLSVGFKTNRGGSPSIEFYIDNVICTPVKASEISAVITEVGTTVIITE